MRSTDINTGLNYDTPSFVLIILATPQQIKQACLHSACTRFHHASRTTIPQENGGVNGVDGGNGCNGWDIVVPTIANHTKGAAHVTLDGITACYDIMADPTLKAAPTAFESQRNHYPHRPEYRL